MEFIIEYIKSNIWSFVAIIAAVVANIAAHRAQRICDEALDRNTFSRSSRICDSLLRSQLKQKL